jgi:uridine kinase
MKKTTIIGIAGGTASGKTTIANKVYEASKPFGSVAYIKLDDYYKDLIVLEQEFGRTINFDHPDAYDSQRLVDDLLKLNSGKTIYKPTYDFVTARRLDNSEIITPSNIIIVEGIMVLAIPIIRELLDIKVYVETPDDIRFIRRLERDIENWGRSVQSVINQYLSTVRPMHITFVEPSKAFANIIIPEGGFNEVAIDVLVARIQQLLQNGENE